MNETPGAAATGPEEAITKDAQSLGVVLPLIARAHTYRGTYKYAY